MRRIIPIATLLLFLPTQRAAAQDLSFLEAMFEQVNSFTFAAHLGNLTSTDELGSDCGPFGLCGLGTEVFIDLHSTDNVLLELALGTNYLQGFSSDVEGMDFHGAVRSVPTIAIYTTHHNFLGQETFQPFIGVSFGLAELWNARVYDVEGMSYAMSGDTFTQGIAAGALAQFSSTAGLFLQGGFERRNFFSLDWTFPDDVQSLPVGWPRELDLSTWLITGGWQFFLPSE
jgi:hypothetical protein